MKSYFKPEFWEELLEVEDVIAASNKGATSEGESGALEDIMGGLYS